MRDAKINVFTDEIEVKGRDLHNLFRRIEESRVAVAILSERYTESSWCLDELVKIKERMDQENLVVIPIFYRLDATNCKRLLGAFGDNFRNLEREYRSEPERIKKWKEALISIPKKVGLTLAGHRDESELVESIVKEVKKVLIEMSSKERDYFPSSSNRKGQSKDHQTQNNIISSFEPLMSELDRLPGRSQVFVSFCKDELGDNFVMHLVWALRDSDSGINVFTDTCNPREKQQQQQQQEVLTSSIEKSNIALAIFSKRYPGSNGCLNELVKMNKLAKEGKLVVIPVFYNVKTNEVRKLEGEFGIHFRDTKERFSMEPMMVQSWEESLKSPIMTGRIDLTLEAHINEFALVGAIVREVSRLLPNSPRRRRRRKLGIREVLYSSGL
ncbi:PREDICTED: disease resistance-like protein CSA1 [Camelina sativa]|uniref:Disease resistance-like protein CSA1 n=1 Tax=Camelina sativa TaxID=90675 RepID=A0ABM1RF60_CAMSA|nr:PREDICTED: disease resistance-like protein CSA1 [Camelina sativa]